MGFKLTSRLSMISDYMNNEINKDVFRVDGSTVTVDGAFKTVSAPVTGHSIQMSFDCYDSPVASLAVAAVPAPTVSSVSNTESVPVTAPEPGKGTITVDGETRSFAVEKCRSSTSGGVYRVYGKRTLRNRLDRLSSARSGRSPMQFRPALSCSHMIVANAT